jgi:hypothetical protein
MDELEQAKDEESGSDDSEDTNPHHERRRDKSQDVPFSRLELEGDLENRHGSSRHAR